MKDRILFHISKHVKLRPLEQQEILDSLQEEKISKKQFLIKPGQEVNSEYFVLKGCLRTYYRNQAGLDHVIQFAVEDWWTGDFEAFFFGRPAKLHIEAIEDSHLLALKKDKLELLYQKVPGLERYFRIITTNAFVALRTRVLSTLEKSGKERYLEFCTSYPQIEKRVSNAHIANYFGLTPESLSRIRKELV